MTISPQSQSIYKTLLTSGKSMEAKDLAEKLNIFPAAVYRLTKPLVKMGLIIENDNYPAQFTAKPVDEGLSLFLLAQNDWFSQKFYQPQSKTSNNIPPSRQISLFFIQSRDELMSLSEKEIKKTNASVDLLRSGHEIPADVMLACTEAIKRGVQIRMLIQDYSSKNAEEIANWQKNGILVRKTKLRNIRLMLYDSQAVYFMSYKHTDSTKDLGMKINYPPFAAILSQLFNQWWNKAVAI